MIINIVIFKKSRINLILYFIHTGLQREKIFKNFYIIVQNLTSPFGIAAKWSTVDTNAEP